MASEQVSGAEAADVEHAVSTLDVEAFSDSLERLLEGYRSALRFVEQLPRWGLRPVLSHVGPSSSSSFGFVARLLPEGVRDRQLAAVTDELAMLGRRPTLPPEYKGRKLRLRFVARFPARVYVETHVRRKLGRISDRLAVETMSISEDEDVESLKAIESTLRDHVGGFISWQRIRSLIVNLPLVTIVFAILISAGRRLIEGESFESEGVLRALFALAVTLLLGWILLVWPSIRLGFRVKRAIFAGGRDHRHPFWYTPGLLTWTGFPASDVYGTEDAVFELLAIRKRREFPIDFAFAYTLWFAVLWTILTVSNTPNAIDSWQRDEIDLSDLVSVVFFNALLALVAIWVSVQGFRNVRQRQR